MTRTIDQYARGRRFRVVRPGASIRGLVPDRGAYRGWTQTLRVGDVIECLGFGRGWGSDPGYGVHWTTEVAWAAGATFAEFFPSAGGMWQYHPQDGFLEPERSDECSDTPTSRS